MTEVKDDLRKADEAGELIHRRQDPQLIALWTRMVHDDPTRSKHCKIRESTLIRSTFGLGYKPNINIRSGWMFNTLTCIDMVSECG